MTGLSIDHPTQRCPRGLRRERNAPWSSVGRWNTTASAVASASGSWVNTAGVEHASGVCGCPAFIRLKNAIVTASVNTARLLAGGDAAVDRQDGAGDVRARTRRQEDGGPGHVVGPADA